jgi:hypothetical protein
MRRNKVRHPKTTHTTGLRHRCTPPGLPLHSSRRVLLLRRIERCDPTEKKFADALAKILSAGQKETGMTGIFERRQIINTPKKPL